MRSVSAAHGAASRSPVGGGTRDHLLGDGRAPCASPASQSLRTWMPAAIRASPISSVSVPVIAPASRGKSAPSTPPAAADPRNLRRRVAGVVGRDEHGRDGRVHHVGPRRPVGVLGVPAGDERVVEGDAEHGVHPRCPRRVVVSRYSKIFWLAWSSSSRAARAAVVFPVAGGQVGQVGARIVLDLGQLRAICSESRPAAGRAGTGRPGQGPRLPGARPSARSGSSRSTCPARSGRCRSRRVRAVRLARSTTTAPTWRPSASPAATSLG